jgi:hypothetical protein
MAAPIKVIPTSSVEDFKNTTDKSLNNVPPIKNNDKKAYDVKKVESIDVNLPCKVINKFVIEKIVFPDENKNIKGKDISDSLYNTILMIAPPNSGKTTVIRNLIHKIAGKATEINAFVGTIKNDKMWKTICEEWESLGGTPIKKYNSIWDDKNYNQLLMKIDKLKEDADRRALENLDKRLKAEKRIRFEDNRKLGIEEPNINGVIKVDKKNAINEEGQQDFFKNPEEKDKNKIMVPAHLFIYDDLSRELRSKTLTRITKEFRHYKIYNIISTQDYMDIPKDAREMVQIFILFPGVAEDRLKKVHIEAGIDPTKINFRLFKFIYRNITSQPHQFLFINRVKDDYRHNFDKQIDIEAIKKEYPELASSDARGVERDIENQISDKQKVVDTDKKIIDENQKEKDVDEELNKMRNEEENQKEKDIELLLEKLRNKSNK